MGLDKIKFVFLWTDLLIIILLLSIIFLFYLIKTDRKVQLSWQKISKKRTNIIALTILGFYFFIAVIDSVHFRYALEGNYDSSQDFSTEVVSILDVALNDLRANTEKTYSAPFALYGYSKEIVEIKPKIYEWQKVRLKHAGQHLQNDDEFVFDVLSKISLGLFVGLLSSFLLYLLFFRKKLKVNSPYKILFSSLSILIIVISICYVLMPYYHILGTDKVGKDVLYASLKSIRTGIIIGVLTTVIMLPFAITFGAMAGYFRGIVDDIIQYLYTTISSIPGVLLIAASILTLQVFIDKNAGNYLLMVERTDLRLLTLCFVLGITGWIGLCRLIRAETMKLSKENYILAAKALGISNTKIIIKHLVPNLSHIILIAIALDFSGLVLAEAVLSYVGVGVDPSTYSWGNMINGARMEMAREPIVWWSLAGAFTFMFILVFCANIFSDAVRDALDPRIN